MIILKVHVVYTVVFFYELYMKYQFPHVSRENHHRHDDLRFTGT